MKINLNKILSVVRELEEQAFEQDMEIDWETASLRVPILRTLSPHERDIYVRKWQSSEYWKNINDMADIDPPDWERD